MTTPLPTSVPSDGNLRVDFVTTIANLTAPKASTELAAVSSQTLAEYITGDGWKPSGDQATVSDERLASKQTFEQPGRISESLELTYVNNPASPSNNEAYTTLAEGAKGYLVARYGVPRGQAWAAGDIVDVYPATCGRQRKQWNGANSVMTVNQKIFVTSDVVLDAVVVA